LVAFLVVTTGLVIISREERKTPFSVVLSAGKCMLTVRDKPRIPPMMIIGAGRGMLL